MPSKGKIDAESLKTFIQYYTNFNFNIHYLPVLAGKGRGWCFAERDKSAPTPAAIPTPRTSEGRWRFDWFLFCIISHCNLTSSGCHRLKCTASIILISESRGARITSKHTGQETFECSLSFFIVTLPATAIALSLKVFWEVGWEN